VIADGIDTAAQWAYCAALGCTVFQGNHLAVPAAAAALPQPTQGDQP